MTRISIFAMRSWGELGNLLAAKTLAAAIRTAEPAWEVEVLETDDFCPTLARTGEEIALLARRTADDPPLRRRGYLEIIERLSERLPPGFETAEPPGDFVRGETAALGRRLRESRPHLAVATKGVIARLLLVAARQAGAAVPVVNFVTNHGLQELALHRAPGADLSLVQLEAARASMVERFGYPPERVRVVGPLVAGHELRSFVEGRDGAGLDQLRFAEGVGPDEPVVVMFSNRGGKPFLELLRLLGEAHPRVPVLFIAHNDPPLLAAARALEDRLRPERWTLVERLTQAAYFHAIRQLEERPAVLVSKAGPNTVMEGLYFGLVPLVLVSGLPMEDWVGSWLTAGGLGVAAPEVPGLVAGLDDLLRRPERLAALKRAVLAFRAAAIRPEETASAIARALAELAPQTAAGGES